MERHIGSEMPIRQRAGWREQPSLLCPGRSSRSTEDYGARRTDARKAIVDKEIFRLGQSCPLGGYRLSRARHVRNLSKVTPPTPHRVHLNRRLFARLDAASEKPIVWIHAPPGAGKTTLAASYLPYRRIEPLWYRLDEGDADPATLFLYLSAAWKGRKSGLSLPVLTPDKRAGLPMFARQFFRTLFSCPKTTVLVFDDYHEVAPDSALHQCIAGGLEEVPRGCRVMFVSRAAPPAAFAKLRMNGLVEMVEPDALRLTLDEAHGVARERQADIATNRVEAILLQTQGWTAGLILMLDAGADALTPQIDGTETSEVLFDYFAGEILDRMPADRQRLLCILALMPTMTATAASRLADSTDAEILLEELRRRNYFTVRDVASAPRYRFHPLFREFLLAQSRTRLASDELERLKIRAASVLIDSGQAEDAARLLEDAGAFGALADLVVGHAETLTDEGRYETLAAWVAKIPPKMIETNAWLTYWSGAAHVFSRPAEALPKLTKAFDLFRRAEDVVGQYTAWARQAEAVRIDAFGDQGRFDALLDSMTDLRARHPDIPPGKVMLRVALSMAIGLSRRTARRDEIAFWQDQARAAAKLASDDILSHTVGYWFAISWLGSPPATRIGAATLPPVRYGYGELANAPIAFRPVAARIIITLPPNMRSRPAIWRPRSTMLTPRWVTASRPGLRSSKALLDKSAPRSSSKWALSMNARRSFCALTSSSRDARSESLLSEQTS